MLMFIPTCGISLLFWMNNGVRLKRENHNVKTLIRVVALLVGLGLSKLNHIK